MARVVTIVQTSSSIPTTSGISIVISQTTNPGSVVGGISDAAYNSVTWDGVTTDAPSKNAVRDKIVTMDADISSAKTKTDFITVTQAVDLDTLESDTATNNAKVTNATHTGEVTGSGALTVDKTAITNKTAVTYDSAADYVLISDGSDSGNLKKAYITSSGGGLTNWTDSINSSAPNATVLVSEFTATNAATNVDAAIKAKGTGAHLAQTPDSTATGGDKRGQYSVDWQKARAAADQVASGNYSSVGGGERNKASAGWTTVAGGYNNRARGSTCVVSGGESNDATSNSSTVSGGSSNATANDYAFITGGFTNSCSGYISGVLGGAENSSTYHYTLSSGYRAKAYLYGQMSRASGMFGAVGDAQGSELTLRRAITGTTATELFLDGSSLQAVLNSNSLWNAEISVVAIIKTVGDGTVTLGDVHGSNYRVTIKNIGGTTALVGSVEQIGTDSNDAGMAGCDVTITADNTNDCLKITFTPPTAAGSTTVTRVVASVKLTEVAN